MPWLSIFYDCWLQNSSSTNVPNFGKVKPAIMDYAIVSYKASHNKKAVFSVY